jgi:hypothetical protein
VLTGHITHLVVLLDCETTLVADHFRFTLSILDSSVRSVIWEPRLECSTSLVVLANYDTILVD